MVQRTRKRTRLEDFDYGQAGGYFVTVCSEKRVKLFGEVVPDSADSVEHDAFSAPFVKLSQYGQIVQKYIMSISSAYRNVCVDKYVIMPNHIHLILRVVTSEHGAPGSSRPTQLVPRVIGALKRFSNQAAGFNMWQSSYHDHIIRSEADYLRIWNYIDTNPARWRDDCYYDEI